MRKDGLTILSNKGAIMVRNNQDNNIGRNPKPKAKTRKPKTKCFICKKEVDVDKTALVGHPDISNKDCRVCISHPVKVDGFTKNRSKRGKLIYSFDNK